MFFKTCGISRKRIALVILGLCIWVVYLLWNKRLQHIIHKDSNLLYFDTKFKFNEKCIYDKSSTLSMIYDDEIVVAEDKEIGQVWTLGHVRRDPTSEAWLLLKSKPRSDNSELVFPNLVLDLKEKLVEPSARNRTNGRFLIFNRVPKCASSMFVDLFWKLMLKQNNHFRYYSWKNYWERQLTKQKEEEFLEWLTVKKNAQAQYKYPFAMDRHVYFIDSKSYNVQKGIFIASIIRM